MTGASVRSPKRLCRSEWKDAAVVDPEKTEDQWISWDQWRSPGLRAEEPPLEGGGAAGGDWRHGSGQVNPNTSGLNEYYFVLRCLKGKYFVLWFSTLCICEPRNQVFPLKLWKSGADWTCESCTSSGYLHMTTLIKWKIRKNNNNNNCLKCVCKSVVV